MLTVTSTSQSSERSLAPAPGVTPPPTEGSSYRFLSDVIIARGLVQPAAMKTALQASLAGRSLTEILVDNGHLGEDDLARTLAEHHRLDHVDLEVFEVDTETASLIAPDVAQRFGAVPIAVLASGVLVVALHDPNGSTAALEFARLTGRIIQPAVASRSQVEALIESLRHKQPVDEMLRAASSNAGPALGQAVAPSAGLEPVAGGQAMALPASPAPVAGGPAVAFPASPEPVAAAPVAVPPPVPAPSAEVVARSAEVVAQLGAARQRAETAEWRCQIAEDRTRAAEERTRLAEARARASEERAQAAEELVDAAARAGDMSPAASAAVSEMLERLLHACELLEGLALSRGPEAEALRAVIEAERSHCMQLEAQLRYPPEALLALQDKVAELERRMTEPEVVAEPDPAPLAAPEPDLLAAPDLDLLPPPAPDLLATPEPEPELAAVPEPELVAEPEPERAAEPEPEPAAEPDPDPGPAPAPAFKPFAAPGAGNAPLRTPPSGPMTVRRRPGLFGARRRST